MERVRSLWNWTPDHGLVRGLIVVIASLLAFAFIGASILFVLGRFFGYGLPPCTDDNWYETTQIIRVAALFFGGIVIIFSSVRHKPALLLLGLVIGGVGWAINMQGEAQNREVIKECKAWTVAQAMNKCGAKADHYRIDPVIDNEGRKHQRLTLVAPGTTDKAYNCLWLWSLYGDIYGFEIDESVYVHARSQAK